MVHITKKKTEQTSKHRFFKGPGVLGPLGHWTTVFASSPITNKHSLNAFVAIEATDYNAVMWQKINKYALSDYV